MSIENAIKQGLSGTRHSTVLASERKLVKRLVLKHFQGITDLLMHISGLIEPRVSRGFLFYPNVKISSAPCLNEIHIGVLQNKYQTLKFGLFMLYLN